jgi:acyl-CoA reductase-like NAD-dependent aldehyde dehydrogenase
MSGGKPDSRELLRRIAKLSAEAEWSPDETREALHEAQLDADDFGNRVLQHVKRLGKESPLHWRNLAQAKRSQLLQQVKDRITSEAARLNRAQLLEKIQGAIQRLGPGANQGYAVAFRKFESASDDDLRSMLEELTILEGLGEQQDEH